MIRSPVDDDHTTFTAGAKTVTFVGRPFSVDDAPQHFAWLRRWGLTFGALFSPFMLTRSYLSYTKNSFPHHLGGRRTRRPVRFRFIRLRVPHALQKSRIYWHRQYVLVVVPPRGTHFVPPVWPHGLRRTAPGRPVALRRWVRRTRMDA